MNDHRRRVVESEIQEGECPRGIEADRGFPLTLKLEAPRHPLGRLFDMPPIIATDELEMGNDATAPPTSRS